MIYMCTFPGTSPLFPPPPLNIFSVLPTSPSQRPLFYNHKLIPPFQPAAHGCHLSQAHREFPSLFPFCARYSSRHLTAGKSQRLPSLSPTTPTNALTFPIQLRHRDFLTIPPDIHLLGLLVEEHSCCFSLGTGLIFF